MLIKKARSIN